MSRTTTLTPRLQKALAKAVSGGIPLTHAAELAGVRATTVLEWVQRGEGRHPKRRATTLYAGFAAAIKKAQAQDQARRVGRIEQAARGGQVIAEKTTTVTKKDGSTVTTREVRYSTPAWIADAWLLERTDPKRWGRRDRLDHHVNRERLAKKAQELADQYGLDADALIERAERLANGLDEDSDD
jgi:hypothetical protein